MSNTVFTIGYEGTNIDSFVATLRAVGVTTIADVRAVALSRKKGFSKSALAARLEGEGIRYQHFIELGDPKPGREAARAGRFTEFRSIYSAHLLQPSSESAFDRLSSLCREEVTCLLCFERDPATCHRRIIAERLAAQGLSSFDLYGDLPTRYDNFRSAIPRSHTRQSAAAA